MQTVRVIAIIVAVAWSAAADGKGDVLVAMSHDSGRSFANPVRVNTNAVVAAWAAGRADGTSIRVKRIP